jgi:hypothetical protein
MLKFLVIEAITMKTTQKMIVKTMNVVNETITFLMITSPTITYLVL